MILRVVQAFGFSAAVSMGVGTVADVSFEFIQVLYSHRQGKVTSGKEEPQQCPSFFLARR